MRSALLIDMRSRLWAHLRSLAPANRHSDLAPSDYQQARYVALAERCDFSGAHRHVSLANLDEYADARLLDDVATFLKTGDEAAKERGWQRLCDALTAQANESIDNRLRELRGLRMAGARTSEPAAVPFAPRSSLDELIDDGHTADYRTESHDDRRAMVELQREIAEEARL